MRNRKIKLSSLEREIIMLISKEMANKEIALRLNYSQRMIEYYITNISKKFNVSTRVGIVTMAFKENILTKEDIEDIS